MNHRPFSPRRSRWAVALLGLLAAPASLLAQGADHLQTPPDFKVELVLKAEKDKHGSWISLGADGQGRLLLGGQRNQPLTRLTIADGKVTKEEVLKLPVSEIMGALWAYDALYVSASDGRKFGLFRLKETDKGEWFSEMLREWQGGSGEHGTHGIVLGKDGLLYIVAGNFVNVPVDVAPTSQHRNYADDVVLPRSEDGNGFGAGRKPPGGYVVRMDKDGKNPEMIAAGQRNTYDIAFNADGELFGFDSDMEWDWGTPWYRATRAFHITSGADHGFREGTAKWPQYYPDSLPAVVDIGIGSPTGVAFGTGARFPAKYQKAFYILDWTFGRVIAVHLTPDGAGYKGTYENFVAPKGLTDKGGKKTPNNVTDVVIGNDGAMYFTTGGRNTPGQLFRVTYTGQEPTAPDASEKAGAEARAIRHGLEQFHREPNPTAIDAAWKHLSSSDRYLRYAARIAIERQPVEQWKAKALAEKDPRAATTALLALARYGSKEDQPAVIQALTKLPDKEVGETLTLEQIRVAQVSIARHGKPDPASVKLLTVRFGPLFPAQSPDLNRELSQTLIALDYPGSTQYTIKLLESARTQEEQVGYAVALRHATTWTPEQRKAYFAWWTKDRAKDHPADVLRFFDEAGRPYGDGASFPKFLGNLHNDARKALTPAESMALAPVLDAYVPPGARPPRKPLVAPSFVKNWEMKELEPLVAQPLKMRNFDRGREAIAKAQCLACHRMGNEGGAVGPDITAVSSRFNRRDLLESIVEPNKVISEQYQNAEIRLKDGDVVAGRVMEEKPDALVVMENQLEPSKLREVKKADIQSQGPSKLSPMPEALVNVLTQDEILDLLAYIESGGNKNHAVFKP